MTDESTADDDAQSNYYTSPDADEQLFRRVAARLDREGRLDTMFEWADADACPECGALAVVPVDSTMPHATSLPSYGCGHCGCELN